MIACDTAFKVNHGRLVDRDRLVDRGILVVVDRKQLQRALERVVTKRSKYSPFLSTIELSAKENTLTIRAGDSESFTLYDLEVKTEIEGKVYVNKQDLVKALKEISDKEITLESEDGALKIITGSSIHEIEFQDGRYVNGLSPKTLGTLARIKGQELLKGLEKGTYAVSTRIGEPIGTGIRHICFHFYDEYLNIVSSDLRRLAVYRLETGYQNEDVKYLLPQYATMKILKKLIDEEETVEISICSDRWLSFKGHNWVLYAYTFKDKFLDFQKAILDGGTEITINKNKLINALKKAINTGSKTALFYIKDGELRIEDKDGSFSEMVSDGYNTEINMLINTSFVLDAVSHIDSEEIVMSFIDDHTQVKFTPKDKREHYLALVVPVKS